MDFESTNGCHQLNDGNILAHHADHHDEHHDVQQASAPIDSHFVPEEFKMHVDVLKHEMLSHEAQSHADYLYGNGGSTEDVGGANGGADCYHSSVDIKSNGNGKGSAHEMDVDDDVDDDEDEAHDDFGPETDVDATDDAAISPLTPADATNDLLVYNELNANAAANYHSDYAFIEKPATDIVSAVVHGNGNGDDFAEELVKKESDDSNDVHNVHVDLHSHQFDDNRFMEDNVARQQEAAELEEYGRDVSTPDEDSEAAELLRNKIDFSEKKEYSFDREDFEKESNPIDEIPADVIALSTETMAAANDEDKERNDFERFDQHALAHANVQFDDDEEEDGEDGRLPPNLEEVVGEIITTAEQHVLPTNDQVPVENVIVAESGEDSDDEWNYIKVDKNDTKSDKATPEPEPEPEPEYEQLEIKPIQEDSIQSATPPTASIGEPDIVLSHEAVHTELEEEKPEDEPEEFGFEKSIESLSEADPQQHHQQEHTFEQEEPVQHLNVVIDDDMEQQLNPDAAEFVPTSPPPSAPLSPFSNGTAAIYANRPDLLDDDLLAQSPRKNAAPPMEDFALPSENDFSEISKRPSELLAASPTPLNGNANGDGLARPDSSSSQASYQEMNLKEAMHGDEKQELAAEVPDVNNFSGERVDVLHEGDPMNMSFYGNQETNGLSQLNPFAEPFVDLNAVQQLPDSEDEVSNEREEFEHLVSKPAADHNGFVEEQAHVEPAVEIETGAPFSNVPQQLYGDNVEVSSDLAHAVESSPITQIVQEMTSEVTSILNQIDEHHQNIEQLANERNEFHVENESGFGDAFGDVINKSDLSVEANEFLPSSLRSEEPSAPLVADDNLLLATESAPIAESLVAESEEPKADLLAVAGAAAIAATAAVAAVASSTSPAQTKEPKVTAVTKKPTKAAPVKSTTKPAATATRTSSSSPSKTASLKSTATAAPKPALRTVKAAVEKKTTAPVSSLTARKPIANGVPTTGIKKTTSATTTTTATKSTVSAPKPTVHTTKTSALRTATSSTVTAKAPATTTTKSTTTTTSARVPLSARTVTKTDAAKPKPTTLSKPASAPLASARPLASKPKLTTTSTLAARTASAAAAKSPSPTKTVTSPAARKIDSARIPATKVLSKTTTTRTTTAGGLSSTTTTTTTKRPLSGSTTARTITATKRLTPIKKTTTSTVSKTAPSPNGQLKKSVTRTTTVTTTVTGNGDVPAAENGISKETNALIDIAADQFNGLHINGDNNNPIIDTSAD